MNLDTFNAAFAALDDDTERSKFLLGLSRGMNGGSVKATSGPVWQGFQIGHEMRQEAENFRACKKVYGRLGGRPKTNQQVNHEVDHQVNQNGTQSSILNPLTSNPNPIEPFPGGEPQSMNGNGRDWTADLEDR